MVEDGLLPHTGNSAEMVTVGAVSERLPPVLSTSRIEKQGEWVLKRGHILSYIGLFLYTLVIFFRPYELFPSLSSLTWISYWIAIFTLIVFIPSQFILEGTLTARPREVNLVLLLLVAALFSIPLASDRAEAWKEFNFTFVKCVIMFIVMVNVMRTERRMKGLIFLAVSVGCVISVSALNKYRLGQFDAGDEIGRVVGNIGGMFGNQNDMSLHLVMMIPIAIALLFSTRNVFKKALYGGCALLMLAGNFVTFSRGGFIGLVAGGILLAWKFGRRNRVALLLIFVAVVASFAFAPGGYGGRMRSIFSPSSDGSASTRKQLLYGSVWVALRYPLLGVGIGNSHHKLARGQVTHNAYTQVGAEIGFPALIAYIMFMLTPLRRLRQIERETLAARRASPFYYLAIGLQVSLICYMVNSFFISVAYMWNVYYLVGYAICLHRVYKTGPFAAGDAITVSGGQTARPDAIARRRTAVFQKTETLHRLT